MHSFSDLVRPSLHFNRLIIFFLYINLSFISFSNTDATSTTLIAPERIAQVLANPPRTRTGKLYNLNDDNIVRRIFFYERYRHILSTSPSFALVSVNGISTLEYRSLKAQLKDVKMGATHLEMLRVRNGVFKQAVLDLLDPKMTKIPGFEDRKIHQMLDTMVLGPMIIVYPSSEETAVTSSDPGFLKRVDELIQKTEYRGKPFIVGSKVDNLILSRDRTQEIMNMPSLEQLRAQLIGLLEMGSRGIIQVLEQAPHALSMTLEQRERDLNASCDK